MDWAAFLGDTSHLIHLLFFLPLNLEKYKAWDIFHILLAHHIFAGSKLHAQELFIKFKVCT